jgi:hypothetical protein
MVQATRIVVICAILFFCVRQLRTLQSLDVNEKQINGKSGVTKNPPPLSSDWTVLITVNDGYYDFFLNWWIHFEDLGLTVPVIVIAEDNEVYEKLQSLKVPTNALLIERSGLASTSDNKMSGPLNYDTKEYKTMVSTRATHLVRYLREGKNVIYTDVDTVWRSNPIIYFDEPTKNGGDMMLQVDTKSYAGVSPYYCTGFMAIRSNERTNERVELWQTGKGHSRTSRSSTSLFSIAFYTRARVSISLFPCSVFQVVVSSLVSFRNHNETKL